MSSFPSAYYEEMRYQCGMGELLCGDGVLSRVDERRAHCMSARPGIGRQWVCDEAALPALLLPPWVPAAEDAPSLQRAASAAAQYVTTGSITTARAGAVHCLLGRPRLTRTKDRDQRDEQ